jgi:hypothetical protein
MAQRECIETINAHMHTEALAASMHVLNIEHMELAYTEISNDSSQHKGPLYIHVVVSHLFHLINCLEDKKQKTASEVVQIPL